MSSLKDRAGIQPASIQSDEYDFLVEYCMMNNINSVLEFGPGASTCAFIEAGCGEITSLESNYSYLDLMIERFMDYNEVELLHYKDEPVIVLPVVTGHYNMAFIDAPAAHQRKHFARLNSCMFAAQHTKRILLHDSCRLGEQFTQMVFVELGWKVMEICHSERGIAEMTL